MPDDQEYVPRRSRQVTSIKGLVPALPERGRIKIGIKGAKTKSRNGNEFQMPQKLDHFVVTTLDRQEDGNFARDEAIHATIGDKPTDIKVRLLYDDPSLNFPTRYAAYKGRTLFCSGDGETASRLGDDGKSRSNVPCTCFRQDPEYKGADKCKMNGVLSTLIDGAGGIGGVWKFRTTSYNTIVGIMSSMAFLRQITGGPLANLPLTLQVRPKQATDPEGKQQTIYVVGLEFPGDMAELQNRGHQIALDRATTHVSIAHIEDEARRLLSYAPVNAPLPGDDESDVIEEFYPEQVAGQTAPARPRRSDFDGEPIKAAVDASLDITIIDEFGEIVGEWPAPRAIAMLGGLVRDAEPDVVIAIVEHNQDALAEMEAANIAIGEIVDLYDAALALKVIVPQAEAVDEFLPRPIAIPATETGARDWGQFGRSFIAAMKASRTIEESNGWQMENLQALDLCEKGGPKVYGSICKAIKATQERLAAPAEPEIVGAEDLADPARLLTGG
jgi:hypothetical protein